MKTEDLDLQTKVDW